MQQNDSLADGCKVAVIDDRRGPGAKSVATHRQAFRGVRFRSAHQSPDLRSLEIPTGTFLFSVSRKFFEKAPGT